MQEYVLERTILQEKKKKKAQCDRFLILRAQLCHSCSPIFKASPFLPPGLCSMRKWMQYRFKNTGFSAALGCEIYVVPLFAIRKRSETDNMVKGNS